MSIKKAALLVTALFEAGFCYALPSLAMAKMMSTTGKGLEGVRQSLFDFLLYGTAGSTQYNFFATPKGQGMTSAIGGTVGGSKTIADTNLEVAGQLPSGKAFLATSIELPFYAGAVNTANTFNLASPALFNATAAAALMAQAADINSFYMSGSLQFFISSKIVLEEAPLLRFPPKCHLEVQGSVASNSATLAEVGSMNARAVGRPYMLEPQIYIEPNVNFSVSLNFPAAVATPSGFNARVGCILDGYLYRTA
jgi:hypothetical protein